jgi:hypothetical protein
MESVYSTVVLFLGIQLKLFSADLDELQLSKPDIGNTYLEATTKEMTYIVEGPECGSLKGHLLVIDCTLYRLRSTGFCWHKSFLVALG